jgi:hypothetical protein
VLAGKSEKRAAMDIIFNSDFWKQQWETVANAPFIVLPPIAMAAWAGWWLRGINPHTPDDAIICSVDAAIQLT